MDNGGARPSLVAVDGGELHVLHSAGISFTRSIQAPLLINKKIVMAANFGWLLLRVVERAAGGNIQLCLWSPATQESIDLPPLSLPTSSESIDHVMLTKPQTDPDCVLLLCSNDLHYVNVNGDDSNRKWIRSRCIDGPVKVNAGETTMIFASENKETYSTVTQVEMVKPGEIILRSVNCKGPITQNMGPSGKRERSYVEHGGDIFTITVRLAGVCNEEIASVDVFKLDLARMCWNEIDNCPNAAFFLSFSDQAISSPTDSAELGNRVYLAGYVNRPVLYIYHIQEKTLIPVSLNSTPPPYHWMFLKPDQIIVEENKVCESIVSENGDGLTAPDLPVEVWRQIYSYLKYPIDYLNLRATCKMSSLGGSAKEWKTILSSPCPYYPCPYYPWLMILKNGVMVDPASGRKYNVVHNKDCFSRICYAAHGWLLMYDEYLSDDYIDKMAVRLRFFNPLTKEVRFLPVKMSRCDHYFFTFSPSSQHCVVYGISLSEMKLITIEACNQVWRQCEQEEIRTNIFIDLDRDKLELTPNLTNQSNVNIVRVKTCFYFLLEDGGLAELKPAHFGRVLNRHYPKPPCEDGSFEQVFLVSFNEKLASVYVGRELKWLKVFVLDEEMEWSEILDIGDIYIYLSKVSTYVSPESLNPGSGNRIYLPKFHQEHVVYYSMNTCKFHAGPEMTEVTSYYETKEQLYGCWFLPTTLY